MASQPNGQVGRSMSYRKPVPAFVPSPPPSPTIPAIALELEDADGQLNVPPLPENWREIITTKIQEANSSKVSVHTFQKALTSSESDPSKPLYYAPLDEEEKMVTLPPAALRAGHRRHSTRVLPTQYRAPTPPLPSSKSLRMFPYNDQPGAENTAMSPYNMPSYPGPEIVQLPAETRSLRPSYSFQTDRTAVSHGTGRISTPWSRSFGTLAYAEPSNRYGSTHPKKQVGDLSEIIDARNGSNHSLLQCCGFLSIIINFCRCK